MTNEKFLELINKAIGNLKDNEDGYGQTPIDYMRENGVKSTDNMHIFLDSVGAYLEEIRCGLLADIEAAEAKKNGKSSVISNVRKFTKKCATHRDIKPAIGWANYDELENKYFLIDGIAMLISENADGMELTPEAVKKNMQSFNWKKAMPNVYEYQKMELPPIGKIAAWRKQEKAKAGKRKGWDRIFFEAFGVNGEYLEMFMRITGSTEIYYKDSVHALYMEGNGYQAVIMPIKNYDVDKNTGEKKYNAVTDFEVI